MTCIPWLAVIRRALTDRFAYSSAGFVQGAISSESRDSFNFQSFTGISSGIGKKFQSTVVFRKNFGDVETAAASHTRQGQYSASGNGADFGKSFWGKRKTNTVRIDPEIDAGVAVRRSVRGATLAWRRLRPFFRLPLFIARLQTKRGPRPK